MLLNEIETEYHREGYTFIAGVDEAGRGPLAGPVVAAAVILPETYYDGNINDSKKLTGTKRRELFSEISKHALAIGVGVVSASEIDEMNIYAATQVAMELALSNLHHSYNLVLSDAMPLENQSVKVIKIIKGDQKVQAIAAASIIAKVTRDDLMLELDKTYPMYGFGHHKGYATKEHVEALRKYGPLQGIHRYSYEPVKSLQYQQMKLF